LSDDDARHMRETEAMHTVAKAVPESVDIVALDVSFDGIRIVAMSESVSSDLAARGFGTETDLRRMLTDIAARASRVPEGSRDEGVGPTYESSVLLVEDRVGTTKRVLIEQFRFHPNLAKMYYPTKHH
jgi:enoyl-[acyl-carrier-protein] reductase (NADH)